LEHDVDVVYCVVSLQNLMQHLPKVKHIIYFESRKRLQTDGFPSSVSIHSLSTLEALGKKSESRRGCNAAVGVTVISV